MEAALPWVALGVALVGLVVATLVPSLLLPLPSADAESSSDDERVISRLILTAGAILALLLFAATLPGRPPWSPGGVMGRGFLLGAGSALLAVALMRHLRMRVFSASVEPTPAVLQFAGICGGAGLLSLALLPVSLAPLLYGRAIFDALGGVALGVMLVALVARLMLGVGSQAGEALSDGALLQGWAACAVTLAGALAFGFYHFPAAQGAGRAIPLGLASATVLSTAAGAGLFSTARTPMRAFAAVGLLNAVVVLLLAVTTLPRLVEEPGAVGAVLLGLGSAVLWASLRYSDEHFGLYWRESAAIAALMVLGLYVVAFLWLQGLGVGLALVAAWSVGGAGLAALCWHDLASARQQPVSGESQRPAAVSRALHQVLSVGLLALLFRLFLERYRPLATDLSLTVHFTLVGMVVGAIAPALFAGVVERVATRWRQAAGAKPSGTVAAARAGLLVAVAIAFWALAVPAAVGVAWGMRSLVGLLAGLLVAGFHSLFSPPGEERDPRELAGLSGLLGAILMALVVIQMAHLLAPLGVLHRGVRVAFLVALSAVALLGLLWSAWAGRGTSREAPLRVEGRTSP